MVGQECVGFRTGYSCPATTYAILFATAAVQASPITSVPLRVCTPSSDMTHRLSFLKVSKMVIKESCSTRHVFLISLLARFGVQPLCNSLDISLPQVL